MIQWITLIVVGFVFIVGGIVGFLKSNELVRYKTHNEYYWVECDEKGWITRQHKISQEVYENCFVLPKPRDRKE